MKTDRQLLEEYTALMKGEYQRETRRREILKEIKANNREDSKRLRVALRRLVRNSEWTIEQCEYHPIIDHRPRPVTAHMIGTIELYHFRSSPKSLTKFNLSFSPIDEERTLLYLEAIINATKT